MANEAEGSGPKAVDAYADGLLDEIVERHRSAVSDPIPAHPLDPTYSPSREGSTPMPGSISGIMPPQKSTGPYGMNAVRPLSPLESATGVVPPARASTGTTPPPRIATAERAQPVLGPGGTHPRPASSSGPPLGSIPALFVGRVLADRWEVKQRIGIGGMASVHEGLDHRLARPVAVKILHPHVAENPDSRERLGREARAIAQLKHENVIEVYDYSSDDPECTWLVTELIDGPSLRQILDRIEKPMPEVAVMIVTEVVRALRAAHAMGIVHRDVKPDNILVGSSGRPKLSDFGIAQVVNEQRMTLTGNLVGSPSYMSPEQANGKRTDHRTDLFSAGILLYRLVTGTLPFRGATAIETIRKVSMGEYTDPAEIEPGCAGAVAGMIRRALSNRIEDRYQSADEMLHDLANVLQDSGLSATWEELPKFFRDPSGYHAALAPRLVKELEARGKALLDAGQETRAVDCFNRSLSLGEGDQRTLDLVRELSKRRGKGRIRRFVWATSVALGAIAMISGVLLITDRLLPSNAAEVREAVVVMDQPLREREPARQAPKPAVVEEAAEVQPKDGAEPELVAPPPLAQKEAKDSKEERRARETHVAKRRSSAPAQPVEQAQPARSMIAAALPPKDEAPASGSGSGSGAASNGSSLYGTLQVGTTVWADIYVDGKKLGSAPERSRYPLAPGQHRLRAVKPNCLPDEKEFSIAAGETTRLRLTITCH